jgi:hypothetical protein
MMLLTVFLIGVFLGIVIAVGVAHYENIGNDPGPNDHFGGPRL